MGKLVLKLAPEEGIYVNGALLENGERRAELRLISPNVNILRLRDTMSYDTVDTPIKQVCYDAQLMLMKCCITDHAKQNLISDMDRLCKFLFERESKQLIQLARTATEKGNIYKAINYLKLLIETEKK